MTTGPLIKMLSGEDFPYEVSWVEVLFKGLADYLKMGGVTETPIEVHFENSKLKVERTLAANDRHLSLVYKKYLSPFYDLKEEETRESENAIKSLAELLVSDEAAGVRQLIKYLNDGPYCETTTLRNYSLDPHFQQAHAKVYRLAELKDNEIKFDTRLSLGIDSEKIDEYMGYLSEFEHKFAGFFHEGFKQSKENDREHAEVLKIQDIMFGKQRRIVIRDMPLEDNLDDSAREEIIEFATYVSRF
ncbi:hypothetical protein GOV06_03175 [Candidatus Woesearchaeota archaeon]|nr:hypothetical protein [Candidatus Woesearchaeota archaeon]